MFPGLHIGDVFWELYALNMKVILTKKTDFLIVGTLLGTFGFVQTKIAEDFMAWKEQVEKVAPLFWAIEQFRLGRVLQVGQHR